MITDLSSLSPPALEVAALLSDFNDAVAGVEQTIAVAADGLLVGAAESTEREYADRLAAAVTGIRGMAAGAAHLLGNHGLRQVVVEFHHGYLLVSSLAGRFDVGVRVNGDCDLGTAGYELALLMERLRDALTDQILVELKSGLAS